MPQPSSHQQSSTSHTSDEPPPPQTSVASPLLTTDWNSWGFSSLPIPRSGPFVKTYWNDSYPGTTFHLLPQPGSQVASDVVLCIMHSTLSTGTHGPSERTWGDVYSTSLERFRIPQECSLIIETESNAFLSLDDFSMFLGLLLSTPSHCILLDVYDARLLQSPSLMPPSAPLRGKWRRLVTKTFIRHPLKGNSDVFDATPPIRLSFSIHDPANTLYIYIEGPGSNSRDVKPVIEVIKGLLSPDAMIMLDDLHVDNTYASNVVQLLPLLFDQGNRQLRLHRLPATSSVATSLLSSCVKLPATLVLDFSSPDSINAFVSCLTWILTSTHYYLRARPLKLYLCFKYDAVLVTKDCVLWSDIDNILADHPFAPVTFHRLDGVPESHLKALLNVLLPKAQARRKLHRWHSSVNC